MFKVKFFSMPKLKANTKISASRFMVNSTYIGPREQENFVKHMKTGIQATRTKFY